MELKKKIKIFFIVVFIGIFILMAAAIAWLWYIQTRTNKQVREAMSYQLEEVQAYMSQSQKEKIALLAAKYDIFESQLESLLDEYWTKHDVGYKVRKNIYGNQGDAQEKEVEIKVDLNYTDTLNDLSVRYNIPKEKIACILIDYRIMTALEKGNIVENFLAGGTNSSFLKFSIRELIGRIRK